MKKGSKMTEESKLKLSLSHKGHKWTSQQRMAKSIAMTGHPSWSKGRKASAEEIEKNRISHLGKKHPHSEETKKKISLSTMGKRVGNQHPRWIEDRSLIKGTQERNNPEYKHWRKQVWLRDNFVCKIANPDCKGRIEAHHILAWRDYPELRYQIENGITLCQAHHPRVRAEEKRLQSEFQALVSVSKV